MFPEDSWDVEVKYLARMVIVGRVEEPWVLAEDEEDKTRREDVKAILHHGGCEEVEGV